MSARLTPWKRFVIPALLVLAAAGAIATWYCLNLKTLPEGFASGNGRIEAVEIDVATKIAGRIEDILADEGDFVTAGQVLARMDAAVLKAQLREEQARLQRAAIAVDTAKSVLTQRQAEKGAAVAVVAQRVAELDGAQRRLARTEKLEPGRIVAAQQLDDDRATFHAAQAAVSAAEAQVAAAQAAIGAAQSQIVDAEAEVEATKASIDRIQADIDDSTLISPRDGRVQYRVAEPGEVLAAGGRVLNLVDLADVYMTFFLPTAEAGRVAIGSDVRIVLDAMPQYVIPARATFVADVAQFTPKTVETEEERQKLTFRIKAHIPPELLRKYITQVKTGLPGMAYVRLDPNVDWPLELQVSPELQVSQSQ